MPNDYIYVFGVICQQPLDVMSRRRQQILYERQRLLDLMRRNLGSDDDMAARRDERLQRVRMIEAEMLRVQQMHKNSKVSVATSRGVIC